jgi:hypothetical protein
MVFESHLIFYRGDINGKPIAKACWEAIHSPYYPEPFTNRINELHQKENERYQQWGRFFGTMMGITGDWNNKC